MARSSKRPSKVPKGYKSSYTTYKLITETHYEKPYKAPKAAKSREKPTPMEVKVVNVVKTKGPQKGKPARGSRSRRRR